MLSLVTTSSMPKRCSSMNRRKSSSAGGGAASVTSSAYGREMCDARAACSPGGICPRLPRVKIAVARETREGEARVAMVPELVGKLTGLGYEVLVEPDAGRHALLTDDEYVAAGARVDARAVEEADVLVAVQPPA